MKPKISITLILIILLTAFSIFEACKKETVIPVPPKIKQLKSRDNSNDEYNFNFPLREVKENRVANFVANLKANGINVQSSQNFLQKFGSIDARQQLSEQLAINPLSLLVHLELADLQQLGLSEIDAQMLHFSQWNHQNPFTREVMNRNTLAHANPEKLMMELDGWAAGSTNRLVQDYQIGFPEMETWIKAAQQAGTSAIEYQIEEPDQMEVKVASTEF